MLPSVPDTVISPSLEKTSSWGRFSSAVVLGGLFLFALWFVICRQLSGEWSVNEQYTYGWFVPFFCAYLFWLRWEDRPEPEVRGQRSEVGDQRPEDRGHRAQVRSHIAMTVAAVALLLLLPLRVFEIGNPDWRPLRWI